MQIPMGIVYAFRRGASPETIQRSFPTLTLEQVYATILYYLHNQGEIHAYMTAWIEHGRQQRAEQTHYPSAARIKLRRIREEREGGQAPERAAS